MTEPLKQGVHVAGDNNATLDSLPLTPELDTFDRSDVPKRRRRLLYYGGTGILLVLITLLAALLLVSPVSDAPFRLHVATSFVAFTAEKDLRLSFRASEWALGPAIETPIGTARPVTLTSVVRPAESAASSADRIELWLRAGDDLLLRRFDGEPTRYTLALPSSLAQLGLSLHSSAVVTSIDETGKKEVRTAANSPLHLSIGGRAASEIRFTSPGWKDAREGVGDRLAVSRLGFGAAGKTGVESGLISGGLHFLDKPEMELALYRGTDLRLGALNAEVTGILFGSEGIEVFASGVTREAKLFVTTQGSRSLERSVMPTRYDWLKTEPVTAVGLGIAGAVVAALGLFFALAQVLEPVRSWLHGLLKD